MVELDVMGKAGEGGVGGLLDLAAAVEGLWHGGGIEVGCLFEAVDRVGGCAGCTGGLGCGWLEQL
ncbi:hypothetical protein ACWECC_11615 [Streptomyces microflavus]